MSGNNQSGKPRKRPSPWRTFTRAVTGKTTADRVAKAEAAAMKKRKKKK